MPNGKVKSCQMAKFMLFYLSNPQKITNFAVEYNKLIFAYE